MTTARNSWRDSAALLVALAGATSAASAHRLDEYLQAARITVDPARVTITLDLTPGAAVAAIVLRDIDRDGNGAFANDETRAYTTRVLGALSLAVDGAPLVVDMRDATFPTVDEVTKGQGTIRLQLTAALPSLAAGTHVLRYANAHHPEIGAYLANAMLPDTSRVDIKEQQRDFTQRELAITYDLGPGAGRRAIVWMLAMVGIGTVGLFAWWRMRQ